MKLLLADGVTEVEIIENDDSLHGSTFSSADAVVVTLEQSLAPIAAFCNEALGKLRKISDPDELEIEFGIEAGGEGGLFGLAKTHLSATITIKGKWSKSGPQS